MAIFENIKNNVLNTTITTNNCNGPQYGNTNGTVGITADSGYKFISANPPTIKFVNKNMKWETVAMDLSLSNTYASKSIIAYYNNYEVILDGQVESQLQPTIINNIANTTESHTISGNNIISLEIVGTLQNYHFTTAPTLTYTDTNGNTQTRSFTVTESGNTSTATLNSTINLNTVDLSVNIIINGVYEYVAPQPTVTVTNTITNTTESHTINGNNINIEVVGTLPHYKFTTVPTANYLDNNGNTQTANFTVTENGNTSTATVTLLNVDFNSEIVIYGDYEKTLTISQTLQNCSVSGIPQIITENTILQLTLTAANNYRFDGLAPQIYFIDNGGNYHTFNFTVAANLQTATITLNLGNENLNGVTVLYLTGTANAFIPYIEKYGTINVYKVTLENLADFGQQRFFVGSDENRSMVDLGTFVNSVKRLFFNVSATENNVIKCGNYNTQIAAKTPDNDIITLNCGFVNIPKYYNNSNDFNNEISAFLPFVGYVTINPEFAGKKIYLEYVCNIVSADCVAKLICDNLVIDFYPCTPSIDLIYRMTTAAPQYLTMQNVINFGSEFLKGLTPFIKFKHYADANEQIYNNDNKRLQINNIVGFAKLTEITNFTNDFITQTEYNLLLNELENGVFVEIVP